MVLQSKVVVVAVRGGQVYEPVQWERETLSIQEVRRGEWGQVEIRHVSQGAKRVASQEGICCEKSNVKCIGAYLQCDRV